MLYKAMYLNTPKEVTRAQRPSRISVGMQVMFGIREVNGAATEASASAERLNVKQNLRQSLIMNF